MTRLSLSHDPGLLLAAVAVCLTATFAVFRIRARMHGVRGPAWHVWVFVASVAAGAGIWGTHMLGVLAWDRRLHIGFDPTGVLGSLMMAVAGAHLSFAMAWSGRERLRQVTGGVMLAFAAAATLYSGLAAQRVEGSWGWEPIFVWLSAAAGCALAGAAVLTAGRARTLGRQATGALLLAAAVLAIHVIGMSAVTVRADPSIELPDGLLDRTAMTFVAGLLSMLMVAVGLGAAYLDDSSNRRALARTQRLADATREGIAILGPDRRVRDCNAAFCGLCGMTVEEVRGRDLWSLVVLDADADSRLDQRQAGCVVAADGSRVPVAVKLNFVAEQGEDARPGLIAAVTDLREQRAAEEKIRFLNEHDTVTGLPNRVALMRNMEAALARVQATDTDSLIFLEVRVTNVQEINSLHGHGAADALLAKVGDRLKRLAGGPEQTARLGGNSFAFFVFTPTRDMEQNNAISRPFFAHVMSVLHRPMVWNSIGIEPQVRIGVAGVPQDSQTVADLLMHAEAALQNSDNEDGDGVAFYRSELHEAFKAKRALAQDLRRAIDADELTVYYQPQARAEDGSLCGFEALVRWRHPERGFLPPDSFVGVAEASGLIGAMGEWVLRRACLDAVSWPKPVTVAVNLSPLQVGEQDLPRRVHEILLETGLPPSRLELEITESALFRDYQRALDVLRRLKALGIRIAMDDFGTGFSSLSTLQSFPFDKIKIDKSFVQGVGVLERSTVIVKAVLGIGRGLAIPVVAEGVETDAQMKFLRDEMCASVQGYYIGRPGPVELHAAMFATAPDARPRRRSAAA